MMPTNITNVTAAIDREAGKQALERDGIVFLAKLNRDGDLKDERRKGKSFCDRLQKHSGDFLIDFEL